MPEHTFLTTGTDREEVRQVSIVQALFILNDVACHGQTKPDGNNCAICGDTDHQAFECRDNAFVIFKGSKL